MPTPVFKFFLDVFSEYQFDQPLVRFFEFAQAQLQRAEEAGTGVALNPKACLLICAVYGIRKSDSPPEFRLLVGRLQGITQQSLDESISTALNKDSKSTGALMSEDMVQVITKAGDLSKQTRREENGQISPRHLLGALLNWLLTSSADSDRAYFKNVGIDPNIVAEKLLRLIFDEQKYPDDATEWGRFFASFTTATRTQQTTTLPHDQVKAGSGGDDDDDDDDDDDTSPQTSGKSPRPSSKESKIGGELYLNRTAADDEACLRVGEYAEVLGKFFSKAGEGEFCFALFGHWGRGKTFLMKKLAELLKTQQYETVFFSAWKYPNTPEVWVHLYETIAETVCHGSLFRVLPRIIRAGIAKNGPWPLIAALAAFAFGLVPKLYAADQAFIWLKGLGALVGIGGFFWIACFLWGVRKTTRRLSKDFLTVTRHTEKLGLQATIGKDLKALLEGWLPQERFKPGLAMTVYFAIVALTAWSAWHWFGFGSPIFTPHPNMQLGFMIATALSGIVAFMWVFAELGSPKRILLVVDDLDRCAPDQLLSVMESVKLLVEEQEISKRLQVAMLVEEDILKLAILRKYRDRNRLKLFSDDRLVRENLEKLFNTHLRLPPLSEADLIEVLGRITGRERVQAEATEEKTARAKLKQVENELADPNDLVRVPSKQRGIRGIEPAEPEYEIRTPEEQAERKKQLKEEQRVLKDRIRRAEERRARAEKLRDEKSALPRGTVLVPSNFVFEKREEDALEAAMPRLRQNATDLTLGPRSIRAFVFRYQLARLLLDHLNLDWTPEQLVEGLVAVSTSSTKQGAEASNLELRKVVQQVS